MNPFYTDMFKKHVKTDDTVGFHVITCHPAGDLGLAIKWWRKNGFIDVYQISKNKSYAKHTDYRFRLTQLGSVTWAMNKL